MTINPRRPVLDLKKHFKKYIEELGEKNNLKLRKNFEKLFDEDISPKIS